ncbi:unnamed protein product [Leptosia nina]|uniref:Integrase catalytic domain-containing protein n=1 Tax=Leptosia nina TaxID=320188 RepID=A0AAV1JVC2_9NEOP
MCRKSFGKEMVSAKSLLEIIHTDLCGPIELATWNNHKYFVTILDDYTHFCAVYLLRSKNEVFDKLKQFVFLAENHFRLRVKKIRCDNGTEYSNNSLVSWCQNKGIVLDLTIPYTPQLNGKAERLNRTLMEKTRALLLDGAVPKYLWGEALLTASFLLNRCLTKDDRCKKGILVGYVRNGYKIWYENKIIRARDVRINESEQGVLGGYLEDNEVIHGLWEGDREDQNSNNTNKKNREEEVREVREGDVARNISNSANEVREAEVARNISNSANGVREGDFGRIVEPQRNRKPPDRYKDFIMEDGEFSLLTFEEGIDSKEKENWWKAIKEEMNSLKENNTWSFVDEKEAEGRRLVTSKWIFTVKGDGRYKARLVARGFQQKYKIDYDETYSLL